MSLDDRIRSGLQTLVEPTQDAQRSFDAFRENAYPRRARRRVVQAIAGTIAVVAIIGAATTAVVSSARKAPGFIHPIPSSIPVCREGSVQPVQVFGGPIANGRSRAYYVSYSVYSNGAACRIDETLAATLTSNSIEYGALHNGAKPPLLSIQGNQSPGRLAGVVPARSATAALPGSPALSISWVWTNWCGPDRSFSETFKRLSGSTIINPEGDMGTIPIVPTCNDPSQPSVLTVTPASTAPLPAFNASDSMDLNPRLIQPTAGLTNLSTVAVDQVLVEPDGRTLLVSLVHGDQCSIFARVDTVESASSVRLTIYVGDRPNGPTCNGGGHAGDATRIVLKQALGKRHIVDGADASHSVPIAYVTKRS